MNLYNMGFACGLFAMMVVPVLTAFGDKPDSVLYWAEGYNKTFVIALGILCVTMILLGLFATPVPPWALPQANGTSSPPRSSTTPCCILYRRCRRRVSL